MSDIILGLDLSIVSTGYCIIKDGKIIDKGRIETQLSTAKSKKKGVFEGATIKTRSHFISDNIVRLIKKHKVNHVVVERPSYGSTGNAVYDIGYLHGAVHERILINTLIREDQTEYVSPQTLKKYASEKSGIEVQRNRTKEKNADGKVVKKGNVKDDVIKAALVFFGEDFASEFPKSRGKGDVIDATWLAHRKWEELSGI